MSFISCDNSALVKTTPVITIGSVGYTFEPTLATVAVASGAVLQSITSYTPAKGKWLITGTVFYNATTAAQTLTGDVDIARAGVVQWRSSVPVTPEDALSVSLSCVLDFDGTQALTIPATYTCSGVGNYGLGGSPLSRVQVTRIA